MIEYAVLETRKLKAGELEDKLNVYSKKGWRVKCALGSNLVLVRKIKLS